MSKVLVELLRQRPQRELMEMRDSVRGERQSISEQDAKLKFEEELLDEAIAQAHAAEARQEAETGGGARKVTRGQVRQMIARMPKQYVWPAEVRDAFHAEGVPVSVEALRQSMRRLVGDNKLVSDPKLGYSLPAANGSLLPEEAET